MRWFMLILNLFGAIAFVLLGTVLEQAQRTHSYSVYRELEISRAIVEKPTYPNGEPLDVKARVQGLASRGLISFVGYLAAGACVVNGLVFFFSKRGAAKNGGKRALNRVTRKRALSRARGEE